MATEKFDVAVIGGGPAGIMASGTAAKSGAKVILIEKNKQLGKKLLLTGNGRCNITNAKFKLNELVRNYHNGEFLYHAFSVFGPEKTINFFKELKVETNIEKNEGVFPVNNDAEEVLEVLSKYLLENKVNILFDSEITNIDCKGKKINSITTEGKKITAKKYIICTGGKSYPLTGSNGLGYELIEKLGHTIIKPTPALSSIIIKEDWVKNLQGISLKNTRISVKQFSEQGELLFTHFGISGPTALNISAEIENNKKINLDLFPSFNQEELEKKIEDASKRYLKKTIKNILSDFLPEKLVESLLDTINIDKNKMGNSLSKLERKIITKYIKNIELTVGGVSGFDEAKVTRGGVSLKEIDHKTMKSKIIDNLFFAGEIIDVDGKTGGFNLQMCWSTGYLASCK